VEQLANHPEQLVLGGEERELTMMFSDIRGFTTIAERLDPHGLTHFLNRYLTPMTAVILSHQGTVDKYLADGIMAFWNAPLDDPAHAEHACRATLAMRAELARLNDAWRAEAASAGRAFDEIRIGIGLNTGRCVAGNLGSDQRFDYSVLGDDANLASRLEARPRPIMSTSSSVSEPRSASPKWRCSNSILSKSWAKADPRASSSSLVTSPSPRPRPSRHLRAHTMQ
jgi:adenylate cyclase